MNLVDPYHPFFLSYWRRVLVASISIGWGLFEFQIGEPIWGMLFGGAGLYCAYVFYTNPISKAPKKKDEKTGN